jgi:predicted  nucleic acid-binding Zn-ribbon protein
MSRKALDDQNAETSDSVSKLNDLKSKLAEYEAQVLEHTTAIASARGRCDEFTRGDVGRLQR